MRASRVLAMLVQRETPLDPFIHDCNNFEVQVPGWAPGAYWTDAFTVTATLDWAGGATSKSRALSWTWSGQLALRLGR